MRIIKTRTEQGRPGTEARRECVCTCTDMCDSGLTVTSTTNAELSGKESRPSVTL